MYSQNKEEAVIVNYFKNFKGSLLDIGAFDGVTFSNSKRLLELGWSGVLIEPSPTVFKRLVENTKTHDVVCHNFAIGSRNKTVKFHDNHNAVATCIKEETVRWGDTQKFNEIEVEMRDVKGLIENKQYEFINIDTEGLDWEILSQIQLIKVGCKCLCIEHNSVQRNKLRFNRYASNFNFREIYTNAENSIYVR